MCGIRKNRVVLSNICCIMSRVFMHKVEMQLSILRKIGQSYRKEKMCKNRSEY